MHNSVAVCVSLLGFLSSASALTFTSPTPGTALDPTQPDNNLMDVRCLLILRQSILLSAMPMTAAFSQHRTLSKAYLVHRGSYTVPANTIKAYGTDFQIAALRCWQDCGNTERYHTRRRLKSSLYSKQWAGVVREHGYGRISSRGHQLEPRKLRRQKLLRLPCRRLTHLPPLAVSPF